MVNGSKTFITNGVRADFVVTAVKTTEEGGHQGLSFLIIEKEMEGFSVSKKLEKLGWRASDTAELAFDDVFVPGGEPARRGEQGLLPDHGQLPVGAARDGARRGGLDEPDARRSVAYAGERTAFGRPIGKHQAIRHKVAEMAVKLEASRCAHLPRAVAVRRTGRTRSAR